MSRKVRLRILPPKNPDKVLWGWICEQVNIDPESATLLDVANALDGKVPKLQKPSVKTTKFTSAKPTDVFCYVSPDGQFFVWHDRVRAYCSVNAIVFENVVTELEDGSLSLDDIHEYVDANILTNRLPIQKFKGAQTGRSGSTPNHQTMPKEVETEEEYGSDPF